RLTTVLRPRPRLPPVTTAIPLPCSITHSPLLDRRSSERRAANRPDIARVLDPYMGTARPIPWFAGTAGATMHCTVPESLLHVAHCHGTDPNEHRPASAHGRHCHRDLHRRHADDARHRGCRPLRRRRPPG